MNYRLDAKAEQKFSLKRPGELVGWMAEEDRLGHIKLESTVRHLGIEADDALEMAEQAEVQADMKLRFQLSQSGPWGTFTYIFSLAAVLSREAKRRQLRHDGGPLNLFETRSFRELLLLDQQGRGSNPSRQD